VAVDETGVGIGDEGPPSCQDSARRTPAPARLPRSKSSVAERPRGKVPELVPDSERVSLRRADRVFRLVDAFARLLPESLEARESVQSSTVLLESSGFRRATASGGP
jgi:hypothetical protein